MSVAADAPAETQTALADERLVAVRQRIDVVAERALLDSAAVALLVVLATAQDVVADRQGLQPGLLSRVAATISEDRVPRRTRSRFAAAA